MTQRQSERGNIFFALFGAVALVGVVGAATTQLLRGPVSTVMSVNQKTKADTQMQIASKLAMVRSAQEANNGDCDSDGTIEPLSPDTMAGLTGGGALPAAIGAAQLDPWNTKYGYCAWDLGVKSGDPTCPGSRLGGGNNMSYPVMVIISAGADKVFQTQCNAWADATPSNAATLINKPAGSDDIILSFTYSEAVEAAGGLWSLMTGDPDTITTDKNVAFSSGVEFSSAGQIGGQATFAPNSRLDLGLGGLFLLPTDNELPDGQCNAVNNGALRLNLTDYFPATILEMCDKTIGFIALGGAGATVAKIDDLTDAKANTSDLALFLGDGAGLNYSSTSGANNNIGIGIGAASNLIGGDGNLVLGNGATLLNAGTNSSMVIGHGIVGGGDGTLRLGNLLYGSNIYSSAGSFGIGGVPSATVSLDVNGIAEANRFQFDNSTYMGAGGGDIQWFAGASQKMILEAGGNLGIGIADPNVALDVSGAAEITGSVSADRFIAYSDGSAASPSFSFGSASGLGLYAGSNYLGFGVGGSSEMTLDANALAVKGDGLFDGFARATSFQFSSSQGLFPNGGGLTLNTGSAPQFYLDAFGKVGIGEASPTTALDVSGAIKIGTVPDANCDAARAGSIRYASGDALQVCSSITGNFETIGTSGGGGGGSASYWTRISTIDPRLHYTAGFVGVGINDPQASLHNFGNFLNTGTFGAGLAAPVSGVGTRMMFIPSKGAFRAGGVTAAQWDQANIGDYSTALGYDVYANGNYSVALGNNTRSGGWGSIAMGADANAYGNSSIVMGSDVNVGDVGNIALGDRSIGMGLGAAAGVNPVVTGNSSYGIFMGDQSGVNIATNNLMALLGGRFIIDPDQTSATNIVPSGLLTLDVQGYVGAVQYCDQDGANCFTAGTIASGGVGVWEDASNVIRLTSGTVNYSSASFVFGSPSLNGTGIVGEHTRMIFDKATGAFRAGIATGTEWDTASLGNRSVAFGTNSVASGDNSFAAGVTATATGYGSTAIGSTATAGGSESFALGLGTRSEGHYSLAFGEKVRVTAQNAMGLGLGDAVGTAPIVGGANSLGIFMGDQSGVNFSSARTMGLFGGQMIIDPALPATSFATSGTLALDVQGQIGAMEYCDANGLNCFDPVGIGSANGADGAIQYASGGKFWSSPTFMYSSASGGRVGIGIFSATPAASLDINTTDAIVLPRGVDGQRPALPVNGMIRYSSTRNKFEGYQNGGWQDILTGAATSSFVSLTDTPSSYAGAAGQYVRVNAGTSALEFTDSVIISVTGQPLPSFILLDDLSDVDLSVPPTNGQNLSYNGTTWVAATPSSGTPAGFDRQIQYNSGGAFGAASGFVYTSAGRLGLGTATPRVTFDVGSADDAIILPAGLSGTRPALPVNGMIRYSTTTNKFEGYQNGGWQDILTGAATSTFLSLTDTPASYAAVNGQFVRVNAGSTALEFTDSVIGSVAGQPLPSFIILDDLGDVDLSVPPTNGQNLSYNGTTWVAATPSSGTPAGFDRQIQYNSGGAFGAASGFVYTSAGRLGLGTATPRVTFDVGSANDAIILPAGLSGTRPALPVNGMIRYSTTTNKFEGYQNGGWQDILTGAATSTFLSLTDTPASYAAANGQFVRVNAGSTALEFTDSVISSMAGQPLPSFISLDDLGDVNLSVPPTNGQNLSYNGTAWVAATPSSGTPAGSDRQIQFNSGGAFGAASNFKYTAAGVLDLQSSITFGGFASRLAAADYGNYLNIENTAGTNDSYSGMRMRASSFDSGIFAITTGVADQGRLALVTEKIEGLTILSTGAVGIGVPSPLAKLDVGGTGAMLTPRGTTGERPAGVNGMLRYNSSSNKFEGYQGGLWQDILTGAATSTFLSLTDTPASYAAANGQFVRVNAGSTALEFTDNVIGSVAGQPGPSFIILDDLGDVNLSVAPTNGQILSYNGTTWVAAAPSSGTPAGSDRQIQFNSGGTFGAASGFVYTSAGYFGLGTATPRVTFDVGSANDAIILPAGLSGTRPASPVNGMIRYSTTTNKFEGYQNGGWQDILTGAATSSFVSLTDTPSSYAGAAGQYVRVNAGTSALEFTDQLVGSVSGQPAPNFISLNDLSNVDMSVAPTGGQSLIYDSATSRWKAGAAVGTPAGLTTQVQFNNAGAFGADSGMTYTTGALNVTGAAATALSATTTAAAGSALSGLASGTGVTYGVYGSAVSPTGFALYGSGNLHVTGNISYAGTLTDTSDMRLKTDIHPLRNRGSMLEKIGAIDTYSFRMKDEATRQIEFGVMAQELQKIFPELVKVDQSSPEKYLSVNYIGLITPLISATQELKAENDNLKAQLDTLETRLASMETDMQGMKVHTGYGIGRAEIGLWMVAGMGGFMIVFFFGGKIRRRLQKLN